MDAVLIAKIRGLEFFSCFLYVDLARNCVKPITPEEMQAEYADDLELSETQKGIFARNFKPESQLFTAICRVPAHKDTAHGMESNLIIKSVSRTVASSRESVVHDDFVRSVRGMATESGLSEDEMVQQLAELGIKGLAANLEELPK